MYYVIKNGDHYMGGDGLCTPDRNKALKIDPALVLALRAGGWDDADLFADADDRGMNGIGCRIVKVNQSTDDAGDAAPVYVNGRPV